MTLLFHQAAVSYPRCDKRLVKTSTTGRHVEGPLPPGPSQYCTQLQHETQLTDHTAFVSQSCEESLDIYVVTSIRCPRHREGAGLYNFLVTSHGEATTLITETWRTALEVRLLALPNFYGVCLMHASLSIFHDRLACKAPRITQGASCRI
ncbi:hypothetical protein LY78DRAFT_664217 [Colletotrichum sublineola]|nr:hypothetical protein LY78DRAFT_664217 [Colletotrichum sublineola]